MWNRTPFDAAAAATQLTLAPKNEQQVTLAPKTGQQVTLAPKNGQCGSETEGEEEKKAQK